MKNEMIELGDGRKLQGGSVVTVTPICETCPPLEGELPHGSMFSEERIPAILLGKTEDDTNLCLVKGQLVEYASCTIFTGTKPA